MSAKVTCPEWCEHEYTIVTESGTAVMHGRKIPVRSGWNPRRQQREDISVEIEQWSGAVPRAHKSPRVFYSLGGADVDECRDLAAALLEAAGLIEGAIR